MIGGRRHGEIAEKVAEEIKKRRRIELGIEPEPAILPLNIPGQTLAERLQREREGAIVLIGRQTFKEFMTGLKRGWTEPPYKVDKEDALARVLEDDGVFDEPESEGGESSEGAKSKPSKSPAQNFPFGSPLGTISRQKSPSKDAAPQGDPRITTPPPSIPKYPPILFVHFTNLVGLRLIPRMIVEFFNRRADVKNGAEAALQLITATPRPFRGPTVYFDDGLDKIETSSSSDLSFDLLAETFYKSSLSVPSDIEKARTSYYDALKTKLATARQLARGEREPTKDERNYPPPTEVELRAERMKKELRWRGDLTGWEIIKPSASVAWDPRFAEALSAYPGPQEEGSAREENMSS